MQQTIGAKELFSCDLLLRRKEILADFINKNNSINDDTDIMHIAFAVDSTYVKYAGITAHSVIKNHQGASLCFHLFVDEISQLDKDNFIKLAQNAQASVYVYYFNPAYFTSLPVLHHFSTAMYYRLAIAEILKDVAQRVLYLDADVLCVDEIYSLYRMDLQDKVAAVVLDLGINTKYLAYSAHTRLFGLQPTNMYFNSGVMLIDIAAWHAKRINDKIVAVLTQTKHHCLFECPDQDVLNVALQNDVVFVPPQYNWQQWHTHEALIDNKWASIKLVHFLGVMKPWDNKGINATYDEYYASSPWVRTPKPAVHPYARHLCAVPAAQKVSYRCF
ncbi:hypothetical protein B0181_02170 [Moraxella caviae]|uniref:Lipopolysaccharide 1,2-glucosyltransferase n=1 Tax=Moraxella caviae TaxID=34060 RepID=A0A1T0A8N5_9GAMM|nr:glycosyltransferase family 8 protein [Moraxella caviae]OOR92105.1 hypothetical protein B0181_02170 [Moraxella caviae]STZ14463.1 Lipopolysaccharide 1,2-glucosyltransferase [Moraxella caviae]